MKKAILLLLALVMCFSCFAGLVSCKPDDGGNGDDTHTCVDANGDGKCDYCGKDMGKKDVPTTPTNPMTVRKSPGKRRCSASR